MKIRIAEEKDKNIIIQLLTELPLFGQNISSLLEEDQLALTIHTQNKLINNLLEQESATIFLAEDNGAFIGYLIVVNGYSTPVKHTARIFISVSPSYRRQGVGLKLFQEMEEWAKNGGINRLELIVVSSNEPAIKLFQKCDFEMEGLKKNSLKVGGQFFHEYIMAKILH